MIKYLGSKRRFVDILGRIATASEAETAIDLFTGTTRVAQEFKKRGIDVLANDIATYSKVLADCYIATDPRVVDLEHLSEVLRELNSLEGKRGYFTQTFCEQARFFQPKNGERIDAIRDRIEEDYGDSPFKPILLTSLMLAADRVDSTTGVQMAFLKSWAARSYNDLELRMPDLINGAGRSSCEDACTLAPSLGRQELVYLDPPYNQHRYFTNYHVWETLIRWDAPEAYGVAQKRVDSRESHTKSVFNKKREMPIAFSGLIRNLDSSMVVVSYNNESWISPESMMRSLRDAGHEDVRFLAFDYKRYVGAQIGIFNPNGEKVGKVSHLRNLEYIFIAGEGERVDACASAVEHLSSESSENRLF